MCFFFSIILDYLRFLKTNEKPYAVTDIADGVHKYHLISVNYYFHSPTNCNFGDIFLHKKTIDDRK